MRISTDTLSKILASRDHAIQRLRYSNMKSFESLPDLASDSNGGQILFATDDFFAVAEQMISAKAPVFDPMAYNEFGEMDLEKIDDPRKGDGWMGD